MTRRPLPSARLSMWRLVALPPRRVWRLLVRWPVLRWFCGGWFLPLSRVLVSGVDRRAGRVHGAAVGESAGWRQGSAARAWQGADRRVAFDRVQSQPAAGPVGEQQRAVGKVLQRGRL